MSEKLLPCPFCGGEQYEHEDSCYFKAEARSMNGRASQDELDEAWNIRYEKTCTILGSLFYDYDISDDQFWETELSCGHTEVTRYEVCEDMFCSQCGAKVVSE